MNGEQLRDLFKPTKPELERLEREGLRPPATAGGNPSPPPSAEMSVVEGAKEPVSVVEGLSSVEALSVVEPSALVDVSEEGLSTTDKRSVSTWDVLKFAQDHGTAERRLSKSEFVTWKLRLEIESGRKRPSKVAAGRLPDDVHPIVRTSYQGFIYLLQCRWNHTPNEPAPWTHPFAACWCGITERQAKDARPQLVKLKALVQVGYSGQAKLWLPSGDS